LLLESPAYGSIVSVARRPLNVSHPKFQQIKTEFNALNSVSLEARVDDVFCMLGTTIGKAGSKPAFRAVDFDAVIALAKFGRAVGATGFYVVSAQSANPHSRFFYLRVKGEMEHALKSLGYPSVGIFRPALIKGERQEMRTAESLGLSLAAVLSPLMQGPLRKYRPNSAESIARAMVNAAKAAVPGIRIYESTQIGD
jgi:uncharacterized protein YbjT (DUF2867 family)